MENPTVQAWRMRRWLLDERHFVRVAARTAGHSACFHPMPESPLDD